MLIDYRDTVYVLSQANKLKGTNFSINKDFPKEIVNARRQLWSEYKRLRSANPDSKTNIVYSAKLVSNGRTVADEFPDWSLIMQASRTSTCSPKQHAEQTKPNSAHDRQDKHNQHDNNRESTMRSLNTARAAPSSKPRRVQSASPHPQRSRSHASISRRSPISSQFTSAHETPNFQRPWKTRPSTLVEVHQSRAAPATASTSNCATGSASTTRPHSGHGGIGPTINLHKANDSASVKFCSFNVNGLKHRINYPEFTDFVSNFDILCLSETHLDDTDIVDIADYSFISKNRSHAYKRKSGGIGAYVKDTLSPFIDFLPNESEYIQ